MSSATAVLADSYGRVRESVLHVTRGLTADQLSYRVDGEANSIAWLIWHLTRVQDDHVADAMGAEQVWTARGFAQDFGLPFPPSATGYGQSADEVAAVQGVSVDQLVAYHEAVCARTLEFIAILSDDDLDRVIDTSWDPPVTLAVRLVSVIADDLQHVGQAAFIRGVTERL
ncbi:mycothiol transferase [Salinibacterium hongtaonis]|uniref:DUF664 domain-containing protein n=1 Tax=Homoserinimonas hongtaonis TaxID=2079791 RepID=A0A2U1SZY9_9MICO|nr:DUF664 domain-containing protein [Salinibacterium hongtaonis]PWB97205.1 hypothetical protein DF220_04680 [Salinibacterium hongtaonis]